MNQFNSMQRQINWLIQEVECLNKDKVYQNNIVIPISISYASDTQTVASELNKLNIIVEEDQILVIDATDTDGNYELLKYMFRPGRGTYGVDGIEIVDSSLYLLSSGGVGAVGDYLPLAGGTLIGKTYYTAGNVNDPWEANELATLGYLNANYAPLAESGTAGEAISLGNIIYKDTNTNVWLKATATDIKKCTGMVGMAASSASLGGEVGIRIRVEYNTSGLVKGTLIYVGETAGTYTTVLPTTVGSYAVLIGKATDTNSISFDFHTLTAIKIDGSVINGVSLSALGGGDVYLANTQTFLGINTFTNKIEITAPDLTPEIEFTDINGYVATMGVVNPTTEDFEIIKESAIKIVTDKFYFTAFDGTTDFASFSSLGAFATVNTTSLQDAQGASSTMIATNEWVKAQITGIDHSAYALLAADNNFTGTTNSFLNNVSLDLKLTVGNNSLTKDGIFELQADSNLFTISSDGTDFNITSDSDVLFIKTVTEINDAPINTLISKEWTTTYITANVDGFLKNVQEDTNPFLGGNLRTLDNDITITSAADSTLGILGVDATSGQPFFVRSIDGSYDVNDGGILLAAGKIELHGANTEIFALSGTDNRQVYVNEQGGLFAIPAPVPGWIETDTDIADYAMTGIGTTWVKMTGLEIALPEDVLINNTLNVITNLHLLNNSTTIGGNIIVGFGVNGANPTASKNIRIEGDFNSLVPVVLSTTTHGGLTSADTITIFVRRETEDGVAFDPEAHGSTAPDHELSVSVPTIGDSGSGIYSFTFPLEETGGTVTIDETNFAKTNIAETFDSTLTVTDFLTIGIDKDIRLTATTNTLNASLSASKFSVNTTEATAWSLPLVEMAHTTVVKTQMGIRGTGSTPDYSFLGIADDDTAIKWFADGSVVINGTGTSTVEHAGFNFFVNGLAKFSTTVEGADPTLDEHFVTLGFADDKYSNEHALSVVKNSNYTTDAVENDYIVEMITPADTVTLDNTSKQIGFRQQILNNTGADLTIATTDPIVGDNLPLGHGLFAYYVLLADGVTWGLAIASDGGGGSGSYVFNSPLTESGGVVDLDETNFAKTDVFETFNNGLLIKRDYTVDPIIFQLQTSTGIRVLDISNASGFNTAGRARFENDDLQLNFSTNFEMKQKNAGAGVIVTFKDSTNATVASVNATGTMVVQDPVADLHAVNRRYLENNFSITVIDNLTTQDPETALSANQGYVLDQIKAGLDTVNTFSGVNSFEAKTSFNNGQIDLGTTNNYGKINFYGGASGAPRGTIAWDFADSNMQFTSPAGNGFEFSDVVIVGEPIIATHAATKGYIDGLIVDNLITQDATKSLSANMGYTLDQSKAALATPNVFTGATNTFDTGIIIKQSINYNGTSTTQDIFTGTLNLGPWQNSIDFRSSDSAKRFIVGNSEGTQGEYATAISCRTDSAGVSPFTFVGEAYMADLGTTGVMEFQARRIGNAVVADDEFAYRFLSGTSKVLNQVWGDGTIELLNTSPIEIANRGPKTLITKEYGDTYYGSSTATIGGSILENQVAVGSSTINSIEGTNFLTWNGSDFIVSGDITATGSYNSSDIKSKNIIKQLDDKFVSYTFKNKPEHLRHGVIAQEIEKVNPELVKEDASGMKSVNYIDLLVLEIVELKRRINLLEIK